jgi:Spy/CpxP family protein refolding chaperone
MSRPIRVLILLIGFVAFDAAQPASAADPRYPDWPCAQAKVPEISLAAVWAGPSLDDVGGKWKDNAEISALVARLSARRTPIEDAEAQIAKFLSTAGTNKSEAGKKLFAGVFETLNAQRSSVMNGLERTTRKQREAAGKIRADTAALHDLQDAATSDQAKIDALANQVGWQTHIFEDRSKVIRFVCDVPNAIDQRIFALGRAIQQGMEE